jgi:hypothetical protein
MGDFIIYIPPYLPFKVKMDSVPFKHSVQQKLDKHKKDRNSTFDIPVFLINS